MAVPNIFASATAAIPLSQLDTNFATAITLGNTAVYLGNTTTSLGNVTLTNVTISSGNVSVSTATVGAGSNTAPSITTTGDTNTGIFFPAADTIAFSEGGAEAMRIDSSGSLGLGVTPSAWDTYRVLEAGFAGSAFLSNAGSSQVGIVRNGYWANAGWKYAGTGTATLQLQQNGEHQFWTAPSGTAGNAITFTQAMTLDASGNLGVGTTSPIGSNSAGSITSGGMLAAKGYLGAHQTNAGVVEYNTNALALRAYGDSAGTGYIIFKTGGGGGSQDFERARIDSSGNFVQKGATTAAGIKPTAIANNESITTVNSTTYTINLGTSAKLFWISLGNGDGALVFTSYISSSITFLGITPTNVVATASPSSAQLGISKSANSHDIVIKTGSALSSTAAAWQMGVLSSQVA